MTPAARIRELADTLQAQYVEKNGFKSSLLEELFKIADELDESATAPEKV